MWCLWAPRIHTQHQHQHIEHTHSHKMCSIRTIFAVVDKKCTNTMLFSIVWWALYGVIFIRNVYSDRLMCMSSQCATATKQTHNNKQTKKQLRLVWQSNRDGQPGKGEKRDNFCVVISILFGCICVCSVDILLFVWTVRIHAATVYNIKTHKKQLSAHSISKRSN